MPYSNDLRRKVITAYQNGEGSMRKLAERFDVSVGFIRDLHKHYRQTGSVRPKPFSGGRRSIFTSERLNQLQQLVNEDNDATLEQLAARMHERFGLACSKSSVDRALTRLGMTRKKRRSTRENETPPAPDKPGASSGNA